MVRGPGKNGLITPALRAAPTDESSMEFDGLKEFDGFRCRRGRVEVEGDDDSTVATIAIEHPYRRLPNRRIL